MRALKMVAVAMTLTLASGIAAAVYVDGNPLSGIDPYGLANSNAARPMGKPQPNCFDFDTFANYVRQNGFDPEVALATLTGTLAVGTLPKSASEMRGFGPKGELNPITGQPSRWAGRTGNRALRDFGRTPAAMGLGTLATAATVFEGYYDWGVILYAFNEATKPESCQCRP